MATEKQKKAIKNAVENGGNISKAMREAGYSPKTAKNPKKLTESAAWNDLMEKYLPEKELLKIHKSMLNAHRVDHMVFPLKITDEAITDLLNSANCKVRKIMHGDTAIHVWFWAPDNKAKKDALDMAYKLRGSYAPEKKDITTKGEPISQINYIIPDEINNDKTDTEAAPGV